MPRFDETSPDPVEPEATVCIDQGFHHVRRIERFGDRGPERTR
jgi:hypothetical protein